MGRKTKADPTGQAASRNRGGRRLSVRLNRSERKVKALFRAIPRSSTRQTQIVNAQQVTVYDYEFGPADQEQFAQSVQFILNDELLETQTGVMPFDWYWKSDVDLAYRQGTSEEVRDFNQLIAGAAIAGVLVRGLPPQETSIESILLSDFYRSALSRVQVSNFSTIKSLSEKTASQVLQVINSGIQAGKTPTEISGDISARFEVSRSDANRISQTEVNKAYNDAKLNATDVLGQQTGLRSAVIHISALSTTTRASHAERHGNAYTTSNQLQWWNTGANRINCKCTTTSVLIDSNGQVVQSELQDEIKDEKSFFDD
jgi:SPP1 gp7 family putative phage head morphogenesis protein